MLSLLCIHSSTFIFPDTWARAREHPSQTTRGCWVHAQFVPSNLHTTTPQLEQIRRDIRDFRSKAGLDKVIVMWTANTERFCEVSPGLNDTAANLLRTIEVGACAGVRGERDPHPISVQA